MPETKTDPMHKALFVNLTLMLSTWAMQQMGKLVNPATGKAETDLGAAQFTIDLLDMIKLKTKGNLDPDETRLLNETLSTLQINFVEVSETTQKSGSADTTAKPENAQTPQPDAGTANAPDGKNDEPRFHKTYG
jgi:hypothetical protein